MAYDLSTGLLARDMADFVKTVREVSLPPGEILTVEVLGERVLIANSGGELFAMGATCNHRQWDLSEGSLSGHNVTCAGHGAVWDLWTGKAEFEERLEDEPLYDVKAESGYLWVKKK